MSKKFVYRTLTTLTLALTLGCATTPKTADKNVAKTTEKQVNLAEDTSAPFKHAPIAPETLYDLLIAEMSGKVNRLEIALGNYMRQAHLTKDPAVIERYARIASYMQAHQATLDATQLWLSSEPTNIDALHLMLTHQIEQGNGKRQEAALRELLTQTAQLNLLILEQQLNNAADTQRAQFHDVITRLFADKSKSFANNSQLWYLKAKTNSLNGQHQAVIEDIKQLQKLDKDFLPSYVLLVDAYEKTNQPAKAEKSLRKLIDIDPMNKKIRIYHTRLLIKLKKYEAAHDEFNELITLFPDDLDMKLTAGVLAAQTEHYERALALFQTLVDQQHRTNEAYIQMALVKSSQNKIDDAVKKLLQVSPSPFYQEARFNAAQLLAQQKDLPQAIEVLEEASKIQPTFKHVYTITIAELIAEYQTNTQSLEYLNTAIKASPGEPSLLYSRAILQSKLENIAASEADLRQVLSIKPNNVAALNALGYTLADHNIRLDEAQILLEKANTLSPNDPPILDSLGWLEYRLGNLQSALEYLRKAYSQLQDHEIAAHLGEVLWVSGDEKRALQIWKEGLQLKPDSEVVKKTMERFAQ